MVAFVLLAACSGPAPQHTTTAPTQPNGDADSMHVLDSTYQRMVATFAERFDAGEGHPVLHGVQEVPWDSLLTLVHGSSGPNALHIDYGLDNDSLRLAFHVVALDSTADPHVFRYGPETTVQDWHNGRFTQWTRSAWQARFQYDPAGHGNYFNNVRIKRTPRGPFVPVDHSVDARSCVLGWEMEALQLLAQNEDHPDSTFSAVFSATGRFDDSDSLHQGTVLHLRLRPARDPEARPRDLLDNDWSARIPLHAHGADFGTLCPPACAEYLLPPQ